MSSSSITFALQAQPASLELWLALAREAEGAGIETLCVADHPGLTGSPFVALSAAAAVTETLLLGTAVLNGGVRDPITIASDVATLDVLSGGRAVCGLGAGHTPSEWEATGLPFPSISARIDRLTELVATVPRLVAGEAVTFDGDHVHLHDASLAVHAGREVPLLLGGSNTRLLRLGAARADIVEFTGLGRTLPDGHFHETRWSEAELDRITGMVADAAAEVGHQPVLSALVQHIELADDARTATARFLARISRSLPPEAMPSPDDVELSPFALIGSPTEIAAKLLAIHDRWGISRYTVRSLGPAREVLAALESL